ncbi:glycosyltransferase family 2 protein [Patescibacteria group bacterium]|nr:glycosyltransferase family 2 protein [Patescibacteria group bacterium]MBU2220163.1 glycosyltransferase family 2 protein [Patescibacteria group bacterium]MBU2265032.1 glycosyltransferase family 2 protein [Patescibacteria group bacterium]
MKLSIIITHYKTPELLNLCLKSVKEAVCGLEHEILVLDSEAQDETEEMIKSHWPNVRFFPFKKNTGYAKIVNIGLREATGEYRLILNADILAEKESLKKMIDYLAANHKIGLLGPQLLNFNGTIQESCFRLYRLWTIICRRTLLGRTKWGEKELARFTMKDFDRQSIREVDSLMGAALMVRRQALEEVGLMDERFFLYFEDTDWCRRFLAKGWRVVYLPEAKMHHYHGRLSKKTSGLADLFFNKYTWIHIASAIKYFWKWR